MSAFLGPIHFWLYNKIQTQQTIVDEILKLSEQVNPGLKEKLDHTYGESETRPLEEVIDQGNIHGWLQEHVSQVEYKLAYSITSLLKEKAALLEEFKVIFEKVGKEKAADLDITSAEKIYKAISDSLLDGMPCDHANTVVEQSEDKVIWKRNNCVHKSYWEEVEGDVSNYYLLREEFVKGFLIETPFVYEKIDEVTNTILRSEANE